MSKLAAIKLKNRLKNELQIIETIDILKQIAVSEYRYMERERKVVSEFTRSVEEFFHFYKVKHLKESIFFESQCDTRAIVVITSEEGFSGGLNSRIIGTAATAYRAHPGAHVIAVGRQGARKLLEMDIPVEHEFPGVSLPLSYDNILKLKQYIVSEYVKGRIGGTHIVYAQCHSFSRQVVAVKKLLPFSELDVDGGNVPEQNPGYTFVEPSMQSVLEYTIALWFGRKLFEIFWDSKLSEVASRAIDLNERYDTLNRKRQKTRALYFRAAHEVIDVGIREIFASRHFAEKLERAKAG